MTAAQLQNRIKAIDHAVRGAKYNKVVALIDKFLKETRNGTTR